jgi:DNA polymerase-1
MIDLAKKLPEWSSDTRMILQVHDELVFEVPETEVAGVAAHIRVAMQTMVDVGVPLLVEAKVGKNWEEMKKI